MTSLFTGLNGRLMWLAFTCMFGFSAHAHQMSTAYLQLADQPLHDKNLQTKTMATGQDANFYGELQLRWFDLELVIGLDANSDGELSWAEVDERAAQIKAFALEHLQIQHDALPCRLQLEDDIQTDMHFDEGYLVLYFAAFCPTETADSQAQTLSIHYSAIFSQDADHKLLVNASLYQQSFAGVVDAENQTFMLEPQKSRVMSIVTSYIYQGILHIFKGSDHILFLCALLLTCAVQRVNKQWQAKAHFKQTLKDTAWLITAFTVAHSLTLTATAMDIIIPSSRWVEFGIALSVMLTALNNIWPLVLRLTWLTFGFGLLHGMGFAGVLGELGIAKDQKLLSVLAFNGGVELGQLMILAVLLPFLVYLGKRPWYQQYGIKVCSGLIAIIALQWCISRF
jgi:hypothetical protein